MRSLAALFLLALLPLGGCDETGALGAGSPEEAVRDARAARQNGDVATALRILEQAHAATPASAIVRAEYALSVLESEDVNLFDLDRLATYLAGASSAAPAPSPARGATCAYATDPTAQPFDPTDYVDFGEIEATAEELDLVLGLLDPIIPDALQDFSLCTGITPGPNGPVLTYDAAAALAEMRALGLTDDEIAGALASNSLARFLRAYLTITTGISTETAWYRLDGGSRIGVCADDPETLQAEAEDAIEDIGESLMSLDLRSELLGAPPATADLLELLAEGYAEIRDALGDYCGA